MNNNNVVNISVNNVKVYVKSDSTILKACESIGINLPRFCYHDKLSVAGNCRMCLVEVEKSMKPVVSCSFPVTNNMKIFTNTPLVKKARENVLELLLINHPLDCPVCDQGGECDLQEQSLAYGKDKSRFYFKKRGVKGFNTGPLVKTIMSRCIHCTRCIRFMTEIAGNFNIGTIGRGNQTKVSFFQNKKFDFELSGNIIDLCPVGALTSKPYSFRARPWELTSINSIDIFDGLGSNIVLNTVSMDIIRVLPRINEDVNEEWISDKTRFSSDSLQLQRITTPYIRRAKKLKAVSWDIIWNELNQRLVNIKGSHIGAIYGKFTDLESLLALKELMNKFGSNNIANQIELSYNNNELNSLNLKNQTYNSKIVDKNSFKQIYMLNSIYSNKLFNINYARKLQNDVKMFNKIDLMGLLKQKSNKGILVSSYKFNKNSSTVQSPVINLNSNNKFETDLISNYHFNNTLVGIEKADLIVLIGTNPRTEAPVLNIRLRRAVIQRNAKVFVLGPSIDLTYPIENLGSNITTFIQISEGKHPLCKLLQKANNPMIIYGTAAFLRNDSAGLTQVLKHFNKYLSQYKNNINVKNFDLNIESSDYLFPVANSLNILHSTAGIVGGLELGINPGPFSLFNNFKFSQFKVLYILDADEINIDAFRRTEKRPFIIYQGHHGDLVANIANIVVPSPAFSEQDSIYINTEGRPQKTEKAFVINNQNSGQFVLKTISKQIFHTTERELNELSNRLYKILPSLSSMNIPINSIFNNLIFTVNTGLNKSKFCYCTTFGRLIDNYYMTDSLTRASVVMKKASYNFARKNNYI